MIVSGGGVPEQQLAAIGASRTFDAADPAFAEWARRGLAMDVEGGDEGGALLGVLDMLGHEPAIDTMGRARYLSLAPPRLVTLEQVPIFTRAPPWRTHSPPAVLVTAISARCQDGAVGALLGAWRTRPPSADAGWLPDSAGAACLGRCLTTLGTTPPPRSSAAPIAELAQMYTEWLRWPRDMCGSHSARTRAPSS